MGIVVEKYHDDRGIIWPESVAPYDAHLVGLNLEDKKIRKKTKVNNNTENIYGSVNKLSDVYWRVSMISIIRIIKAILKAHNFDKFILNFNLTKNHNINEYLP